MHAAAFAAASEAAAEPLLAFCLQVNTKNMQCVLTNADDLAGSKFAATDAWIAAWHMSLVC